MDSELESVLGISVENRKLHLKKIYKDIGEILLKVKELTEIDSAAEMFDYSRRIEHLMTNFEQISRINDENKLVKNILIKEISGIEGNIEMLKLEFYRISSRLSDSLKEKDYLEYELNKLKNKYKSTNDELNEIRNNLSARNEEYNEYKKLNECIRKEVENLELAITLEENAISEKRKELKNLEMASIRKETERRKLDKLASQTISELKKKIKVREIIEERVNNVPPRSIPPKVSQVNNKESKNSNHKDFKDQKKLLINEREKLCSSLQNIKIKRIAQRII
ncbi:hypothetical protein CmeUKMEL1_16565 [Cryptosporidium meleagridis]|uniref:Uncharacterized protein n=1 Tax=Cryptosporidium meleagridis TaxID=93969 RepID=A0A2P4Z5A3_9CRYT|nr:hypothetical protein CmeUKMEL1_16565 [Cryptosporidium meleagridis]